MTKKRTPENKKPDAESDLFFQPILDFVKNFFSAIFQFIKTVASGLLVLLEKILQFIVALFVAFAKIIRAIALAFIAIFLALALIALTFFLFARAIDLPASQNFQEVRERSLAILADWLEPDFVASEARAAAWSAYRESLKAVYRAKISDEEKAQQMSELRSDLKNKFEEQDAEIFWHLR